VRQTSVLCQKFLEEVSPDLSGRKNVAHGVRSCEKINNLTQRRQGAKTRKEQLVCFLCAFYDFVPPRGMKCFCSSSDYFTASRSWDISHKFCL
jgi:hypothetical protein